jgi:SAM-dependent methyltransferase
MNRLPFKMPPVNPSEPNPVWDGQGFVVGPSRQRLLSYETKASGWNDELTHMHEEETSDGSFFIDAASRASAIKSLQHRLAGVDHPVILEVGVSAGHFLRDLQRHFPRALIIGADYTGGTLAEIAPDFPDMPLIQMDLAESPFPSDEFDAIIALNVLEHIERDAVALAHCYRMLKPGGFLVIEVPAGPNLFDAYDKELLHFRRYDRKSLNKKLLACGFGIEEASHIGFLIYPAFWLSKKLSRMRGQPKIKSHVRGTIQKTKRIDGLGHMIMSIERRLSPLGSLPIGIRCTAVCRK